MQEKEFSQEMELETEMKLKEQPKPEISEASIDTSIYPPDKASGRAIAALVLGIAAVTIGCCFYLNILLGPAALIVGILEYSAINRGKASIKGKGFAITGIILGIIGISLGLFSIFFMTFGKPLLNRLMDYLYGESLQY
ncbi:MAG: DUF4190 domain-containing protein [Actinomycetota bacterium]